MAPTRRDFVATTAVAALAASLGRPERLQAWQPQAARATFTPIRRNVGYFTMRGGTIGWLLNPDAVVVVDSQFPAEATACLEGLNARSGNRPVDALINTHHHGDHTGGNLSFRGAARRVVAHTMADQHMRRAPGGAAPGGSASADQLFPDTTFTHSWTADLGDERVMVRHHGRAHTSGDVVITFERANVVHMGDLMFHQRHPVVDRSAGAQMGNWMRVLDQVATDHAADTVFIFGHANTDLPVTGSRADLHRFRDYLGAVLGFVETQVQAGKSREEILAMREPLPGFEAFGRFGNPGPRDALTCAYEEVVGG